MTRFLAENNTFYHGTYNDFLRFRPLSHFGSIYAAKDIVNLESGYKAEPIGSLSDIKPEDVMVGYAEDSKKAIKPKIIPVKLKLKNTYELQDMEACHDLSFYKNALLFHFIDDLKSDKLPLMYDYITNNPLHTMSLADVKKELAQDTLYAVNGKTDEATDRYHLVLQRMIHYFEGLGFDGFHYTNNHEDPGHISYVPFRPESIVRLDVSLHAVNYDFKPAEKINIKGTRNIYRIEETSLRFEKIYHIEMLDKKHSLLQNCKDIMLRPSSFNRIMESKLYYSKLWFQDVLPKIEKITNQSRYGYHGLSHTQQVVLFGIELALSVNQDPMPVLLACALHDCARTNDEYCELHGPRCEPIARKFLSENYSNIFPADQEKIIEAVKKHTVGRQPSNLISACMWDADRIRLSWEMGYRPEFFSTLYGKMLAALDEKQQKKYMQKQEDFLISNGLQTKEKIEEQKFLDAKQNIFGTVFSQKIK